MSEVIPQAKQDFRLRLQAELERRCSENPNYSLRAFARFLGVDSSVLSKILNNKRAITPKMFERLSKKIGLSPREMQAFAVQSKSLTNGESHMALSHDEFALIAQWYHFAILELTAVKGFQPDSRYIARMLGLTVSEVNFAIERLDRLGMIARNEDGSFRKTGEFTTSKSADTSVPLRSMQKEILDQAKLALDYIAPELRDNSTITVAIDTSKLRLAKEMIKQFRRQLANSLAAEHDADAVYQLTFHIFPVSKVESPNRPDLGEDNDPLHHH